MRIEDMKNCSIDQLKKEVVRLSEECEKKQHDILDLKDKIDVITDKNTALAIERESTDWYEQRHQDDCIRINELTVTVDTLIDRYANLRKNKGMC